MLSLDRFVPVADQYNSTSVFRLFSPGDIIFREGDPSGYVYYVQQGRLQVFTETDGQRVVIGEVNSGEYIGELGVLQETHRNASVMALDETHVKELNKWGFIELIAGDPGKSAELLYSLSYRTRNVSLIIHEIAEQVAAHKSSLSTNPIKNLFSLSHRPISLIQALLHKREILSFNKAMPEELSNGIYEIEKNRVLFHEGQSSLYTCRVISGKFVSLKSLKNSYEQIGEIYAGEFIGEIGLLENTPRTLTIVALEDSKIEVFDEAKFLEMVYSNPEKCFDLIKTLSRRSVGLNRHLKQITSKHASLINPTVMTQAIQLMQSIGDISFLTGRMLIRDLYTLQHALQQELFAVQDMLETYYRYIAGKSNKEEMDCANAEFRNFLKTLGLGAMLVIPGSFITIPLVVKVSKSFGIDLLPKTRYSGD